MCGSPQGELKMLARTLMLSTALAVLTVAPVATAGHMTRWYAGLEAGANWANDTDIAVDTVDPFFLGGYPNSGADFDSGWSGMATIGYAWDDWRVELELGLRQNDFDAFSGPPGYTGTGDMQQFSQMLNIVRDIDLGGNCVLSLGAGIGGNSISVHNGLHAPALDGDDYGMAWQLVAGFSHELKPGLDLVVNYRYFNTDGPDIVENDAAIIHNDSWDDVGQHTLTIGLRFDLTPGL